MEVRPEARLFVKGAEQKELLGEYDEGQSHNAADSRKYSSKFANAVAGAIIK